MLQVLWKHSLYANLTKLKLFQLQVHYLGHVISREGVEIDIKNINDILEWNVPQNVVEI